MGILCGIIIQQEVPTIPKLKPFEVYYSHLTNVRVIVILNRSFHKHIKAIIYKTQEEFNLQ